MVEGDRDGWVPVLRALGDESRLRVVGYLAGQGRSSVGEIAENAGLSPYNASKHLRVLREAGIIEMERDGVKKWCRLASHIQSRYDGERRELDFGCCQFRFD